MSEAPGRTRGEYAKSSARRQTILEAAVEVFAASGFHKGSLRDVADRAGLSQAGVLHHFPSKHHLVAAVLTWRDDESRHRFVENVPGGIETVRALVALIEFNQRKTPELVELYATLSAEATSSDHPVHEYFIRRYTWVIGYVQRAFERLAGSGELRADVEPAAAARWVVALMDGLQIQWLYDRDSVDMAAHVRTYIQSLLTVDL